MPRRPCVCDRCGACALYYDSARHRAAWGGPPDVPPRPDTLPPPGPPRPLPSAPPKRPASAPPPRRPLPCLHIGSRTEFRPGCGGRMCLHDCGRGRGSVRPGIECQTCPEYEADG